MDRGRENEHKELGIEVLKKAAKDLELIAVLDSYPRISGRHASAVVSPLPTQQRRLKFNTKMAAEQDAADEPDDEVDVEEDEEEGEEVES